MRRRRPTSRSFDRQLLDLSDPLRTSRNNPTATTFPKAAYCPTGGHFACPIQHGPAYQAPSLTCSICRRTHERQRKVAEISLQSRSGGEACPWRAHSDVDRKSVV